MNHKIATQLDVDVAIIGAGPAGVTATNQLIKDGKIFADIEDGYAAGHREPISWVNSLCGGAARSDPSEGSSRAA